MPDVTDAKVLVFPALPVVDNLTRDVSKIKIASVASVATVTSYN